jgi:hypothetical protein
VRGLVAFEIRHHAVDLIPRQSLAECGHACVRDSLSNESGERIRIGVERKVAEHNGSPTGVTSGLFLVIPAEMGAGGLIRE